MNAPALSAAIVARGVERDAADVEASVRRGLAQLPAHRRGPKQPRATRRASWSRSRSSMSEATPSRARAATAAASGSAWSGHRSATSVARLSGWRTR
jgi:hypothetical protein